VGIGAVVRSQRCTRLVSAHGARSWRRRSLEFDEHAEKASKGGLFLGAQVLAAESLDQVSRVIENAHQIGFGVCAINLSSRDVIDRPVGHERQ
jgi:hypothetical protein